MSLYARRAVLIFFLFPPHHQFFLSLSKPPPSAYRWVWNGPRYGLSSKDQYGRVIPGGPSYKVSLEFVHYSFNISTL